MHIKKTLPLASTPINYFHDGTTFCVLIDAGKNVQCASFDSETFDTLGSFLITEKVSQANCYAEEDVLYLTTNEGIMGYDIFSGHHVSLIQSGSLVPIDFCPGNGGLFVMSGVPLVSGKQVDTSKICVSYHETEKGSKLFQSQNMEGDFFAPLYDDGCLWILVGNVLHKYSPECELVSIVSMKSRAGHPPVFTENFIAVASELGTLEIINRSDMQCQSRLLIGKNNSPPVATNNDVICWCTHEGVCHINLSTKEVTKIQLKHKIDSSPLYINGSLYAGDEAGHLVEIKDGVPSYLEVSKKPLWKPVLSNGYVYIASQEGMHQVEI